MAPLKEYFGGHGASIMAALKKKHGAEAGERIFYATAATREKKRRRHFPRLARGSEKENI